VLSSISLRHFAAYVKGSADIRLNDTTIESPLVSTSRLPHRLQQLRRRQQQQQQQQQQQLDW
jgi:hypothetical protein